MRKWDMAEFEFAGYSSGNPFTEYEIYCEFYNENESKKTAGFYDGDGIYRVRFMPSWANNLYLNQFIKLFPDISVAF